MIATPSNANGVRQFQPRVASTLGSLGNKTANSERVGELRVTLANTFGV
jgi:hypothetical protein